MKRTFVTDLKTGQGVDDLFVLVSRSRREYSKGSFLSLVLGDCTGTVNAVAWDNAETLDRQLKDGDLVRVTGLVGAYNGAGQIRIDSIERKDRDGADLADFMETLENADAVEARLKSLLATIADPWLNRLVDGFLSDPTFMEGFRVSSAAKNWHHAFRGGLLKHTTELVEMA